VNNPQQRTQAGSASGPAFFIRATPSARTAHAPSPC
jgi:hypothetical protein